MGGLIDKPWDGHEAVVINISLFTPSGRLSEYIEHIFFILSMKQKLQKYSASKF